MKAQPRERSPRPVTDVDELRERVAQARRADQSIGLVPTMGALHAGHLSLVDAARRDCGFVVVTVFVNPTQFGPHEDFARYPRTLEADTQALSEHGVDLIYAPSTEAMYRDEHATYVVMEGPAKVLEGEFRPGHFRGVATIVLKLFNLVQPDRAYFGRKDFQQSLLVRHMVTDLNLPIQIEVCPIVREADGLALSSRNVYLSADERRRALSLSQSLRLAKELVAAGNKDAKSIEARMRALLEAADLQIDYVTLADPSTLEPVDVVDRPIVAAIAARVGATRLIDNDMLGETD
jgi:pantoate--beta-alanine ligase